jgi:hypothetical protein
MHVTTGRTVAGILLAGAVLALSACGGSATTAGVASSSTPTSSPTSTSSSTPTSASSSSPSSTTSPSDAATGAPLIAPAPAGYSYTTAPAQFEQLQKAMSDTGMVTHSEGQGVQDSSGKDVAVIVAFQYNPKLTPSLDKAKVDKVLDGSIRGARGSLTGKVTTASLVSGGTHIRVLSSSKLTIAVAYQKGGHLYEVFGSNAVQVTKFIKAYFA